LTTKLTVLGSGDAFNSGGFGNAGYLVEDDAGAFCVDFGPTALQALKKLRFEPNDLDAVFLTHLHGDHFGGLHQLFIDAQYRGLRRRPITIGGPVGTAKRVEDWYRLAYGSAGENRRFATRYLEWPAGASARVGRRAVRTFAAAHMQPRDGALLLRVSAGGAHLSFTGDTAWTDALLPLADGADLLVCECTDVRHAPDKHLSWEVLAPKLEELRARRILVTHLGEHMRALAPRLVAPNVRFAVDGARVLVRGH
jgi:ribonuclease BN (tRNA processing enzyme)